MIHDIFTRRSQLLARFLAADAAWREAMANPRFGSVDECERLYAEMLCAEDQVAACEEAIQAWASARERVHQRYQAEALA